MRKPWVTNAKTPILPCYGPGECEILKTKWTKPCRSCGSGVKRIAARREWCITPPSPGGRKWLRGHAARQSREEMANMISAQHSYSANITAMNGAAAMAQKALEIGR